jgi:hypothetical protein
METGGMGTREFEIKPKRDTTLKVISLFGFPVSISSISLSPSILFHKPKQTTPSNFAK